jgi:hypothetical protein
MKFLFTLKASTFLLVVHQSQTRTRNKKICTHLSSSILSLQPTLGKLVPGIQRRIVINASHPIAKKNKNF